ncbi:MAG: phage integrase central domain-containing protein [Christensenellales bacterium]|jgi:integrase
MATAKKQKNGRYQRSVKIGVDGDGKPIRKFFTATTLKEVDALVVEFKRQQEQGMDVANLDMTFSEMGKLWLTQYKCNLAGGSYRRYESVLEKHLNPNIGSMKLRELKPLHLKMVINGLADKGYSSKTMTEIKQTAAQVLEAAVENDLIHRNVFAKVTVPKTEAEEREPIDEATRKLIFDT